jgi:hypothetical protein
MAYYYNGLDVYAITNTVIKDSVFRQYFVVLTPYIFTFKYIKPILILNFIYIKSAFRMDLFIIAIKDFNN